MADGERKRLAEASSGGEESVLGVAFALALTQTQGTVFLDEAFTGCDEVLTRELAQVLLSEGQNGRQVIAITHEPHARHMAQKSFRFKRQGE